MSFFAAEWSRGDANACYTSIAQIRANLYIALHAPTQRLPPRWPQGLDRCPRGPRPLFSPSDYVRDLIRRDQDAAAELQWLQGEIDKGLASPTLDIDPREVIDRIIAEGRTAHAV